MGLRDLARLADDLPYPNGSDVGEEMDLPEAAFVRDQERLRVWWQFKAAHQALERLVGSARRLAGVTQNGVTQSMLDRPEVQQQLRLEVAGTADYPGGELAYEIHSVLRTIRDADHAVRVYTRSLCDDPQPPAPAFLPLAPYTVMVTGHRPQHLSPGAEGEIRAWLRSMLIRLKGSPSTRASGVVALSGMALGVDTWYAEEALALGVPVWAAVPFRGQPNIWGAADRARHAELLTRAWRVTELSPDTQPDRGTATQLLHERNAYMISVSDAALVVLRADKEKSGGTAGAYRSLVEQQRKFWRFTPT